MRLDLIFSMWHIYINSNLNPLTKFTSSSRSTELKDILPWNISQMITKTISISVKIVISYAMKQGMSLRITVWDQSRKVKHLSKVIGDRKIITEFTRSISSARIGKPVLMMDIIKSPMG